MYTKTATGCLMLLLVYQTHAQSQLRELLEISTANYPELLAKRLETEAAQSQVRYERSDFLPSLDGSYQMVYSTNNNITGMFFPGQILPISGPPVAENTMDFTYGSATSLLMNWSPFTFGKRSSKIQSAKFGQELAQNQESLAILEHQVRFIEAYLNYWAAASMAIAAEKNRDRYQTNLELSKTLVDNGLRPGVDSAQFRSLFVRSKIDYLQAQKSAESFMARVRELLGEDQKEIGIDPNLQRQFTPQVEEPMDNHPLLQSSRSRTLMAAAKKTELNRSLLPDLNFWGTAFARGSAILFEGGFNDPTDGLSFSRYNYGVGFQVAVPILQFARTSKLVQRQNSLISASEAYEMQVERALDKDRTVAKVTLEKALESAALAPEYVQAAEYSYQALQARYDAGLINLNELVQGQADLAKAEAESIKVMAEMWKALLYYAAVSGDMDVFLQNLN
ncbi:MAG: TolC family protein [Lunatimonas sp.]|uniref:TolC family protein n=1 Tax=Lunatimonas sp. TaxID=2060141 RepID=UPI00263BE682|nr:TolC family protein [Lunatimonas sp.]MCC5937546.1 TolC family protein [Lunatimonas sp.]